MFFTNAANLIFADRYFYRIGLNLILTVFFFFDNYASDFLRAEFDFIPDFKVFCIVFIIILNLFFDLLLLYNSRRIILFPFRQIASLVRGIRKLFFVSLFSPFNKSLL